MRIRKFSSSRNRNSLKRIFQIPCKASALRRPASSGFTLIELLAGVGILAVLVALLLAVFPYIVQRGQMAESTNNLRQIGLGFRLYANDNDLALPSRVLTGDKWPRLLRPYLGENEKNKVYADPADPLRFTVTNRNPFSNGNNNTSYIMNGFNDLGTLGNESKEVKITMLERPGNTLLAAVQNHTGNFYLDIDEGDSERVLEKRLYGKGSVYLFADGSSRFIAEADYDPSSWSVQSQATN